MKFAALVFSALAWGCAGASPNPGPNGVPPPATGPTLAPVVAEPPAVAEGPLEPDQAEPAADVATGDVSVSNTAGWTTFHGDNRRSGASGAPAIKQPRIAWKSQVGISSWLNAPVVLGKTVVLIPSSGKAHDKPDPDDGVHALDYATGKRRWFAHFDQDANGVAATKDRVFATSDDGHLYALDLKNGAVAWKQAGHGKMYTHPLLLADRVIVGDAGGWVRAFAMADGKELWKLQLTGAIRGGAAADDTTIYVSSQGGEVAALTTQGKVIWRAIIKRPAWNHQGPEQPLEIYSPPVVGAKELYVAFARDTYYTGEPAIFALDKKTGKIKWRAKGPGDWGNVRSTPVLVAGKLIYGEPYSGDVAAIDVGTGHVSFRKEIGPCYFPQWASPAAAGNLVYLPRFDGSVYALEATSGKVAWELYLGDSNAAGKARKASTGGACAWDVNGGYAIYAPAALSEEGELFVGTAEGFVYAIRG
jgi:outer membrane protein assembly factor BamB